MISQAEDQVAFISYIDQETGRVLKQDQLNGQAGDKLNYQPLKQLNELKRQGYTLAYNGLADDAEFADNDGMNQIFVIILKHNLITLDPHEDHQAGAPLSPQNPGGATWPDEDNYRRTNRLTIHFLDNNGQKLHADINQEVAWTRKLTIDQVTGEIKNPAAIWQPAEQTYHKVKVPVVNGYLADESEIIGQPVTHKDLNYTVIYQPLGRIIPVLADGKTPVPNSVPIQYKNDPQDPTRAFENELVPKLDGFVSQATEVNLTEPEKDTFVIYRPQIQHAIFNYVDADTNEKLSSIRIDGRIGELINYDPMPELQKLLRHGYTLVNNDFQAGMQYQTGDAPEFTIKLRHQKENVVTSNASEMPTRMDEEIYNFTVHFIDQTGTELVKDNIQTSHWQLGQGDDAKLIADTNHYKDVPVPVLDGYYANQAVVKGQLAVRFNLDYTVIYRRLGKIIPVDKHGKQIKGVDQPYYQNDPNDPTKIMSRQTMPVVDGYIPELTILNPDDPNENTEVVYRPTDD